MEVQVLQAADLPEYPIVETFVALLFTAFYILWYVAIPNQTRSGLSGVHQARVGTQRRGPDSPAFTVLIILLGSLVAMTIVDQSVHDPARWVWP